MTPGQIAQIAIGQAGKTAEYESVTNELHRTVMQIQCKYAVQFIQREEVAAYEFAVEFVIPERVAPEQPFGAGQFQDVLEGNQVNPYRIGAAPGLLTEEGMESGHEFGSYFRKSDIGTAISFADILPEMFVHASIFIIGMDAPAHSDHMEKMRIVVSEECQQVPFCVVLSQEFRFDHSGGNAGRFEKKPLVTCRQMEAQLFQANIRLCRILRMSENAPFRCILKRRFDAQMGGELRPLSVDGDAGHDRRHTASQRGVPL